MSNMASDALEAFERLGLTSYEAKVFIALQRLGSGTARDVSDIVDVPRSQVYGVAENLENRALIEVQQSSPIRYRPVSIDEGRERLRNDFEAEQKRAFEYVESIREEADGNNELESVWTVRRHDRVGERVRSILRDADQRIFVATSRSDLIDDDLVALLGRYARKDITVRVFSDNDVITERIKPLDGITTHTFRHRSDVDDRWGRMVVADTDTILLSAIDDDGTETAIWGSQSPLAFVLVELATSRLDRSWVVA